MRIDAFAPTGRSSAVDCRRAKDISAGHKVAVVGLGGLDRMRIKFAKAMAAEVTLFTRSPDKEEETQEMLDSCAAHGTASDMS